MADLKQKGVLFVFYVGQLIELGLVDVANGSLLTPKGFDAAMEAKENGVTLSEEEFRGFISETPGMEDEEFQNGIFELVSHLQKVGYDVMKEEVLKYKDEKEISNI